MTTRVLFLPLMSELRPVASPFKVLKQTEKIHSEVYMCGRGSRASFQCRYMSYRPKVGLRNQFGSVFFFQSQQRASSKLVFFHFLFNAVGGWKVPFDIDLY